MGKSLWIRNAVWWSDAYYITGRDGRKPRERLEDWRNNVYAEVEEFHDGRASWRLLDKDKKTTDSGVEINRAAAKAAAERALRVEEE